MSRRQTGITLTFAAVAALLAAALGWFGLRSISRRPPLEPVEIPRLPEPAGSPFQNAAGPVRFVGQKTCAECHFETAESYQATAHAAALKPVHLPDEPQGAEFYAPSSGRWYEVYRDDERLWHRESIRTDAGDVLISTAHPMKWVIGSGRFSQSYLVETDGFLVQSPITWYRARPGWALSPGYERYNSSFERPVEIRCLLCHVGRAEPVAGSFHRLRIHTQAIDCERCHGRGGAHVDLRRSGEEVAVPDLSIVHPGRLDRKLSEDVCAQCHLHSAAMVDLRGRRLSDFRPGLRLRDFSIAYGFESPSHEMHVVGHMEQMRLSRCYQASDSLTCITCHDPHHSPDLAERVSIYRAVCLECHTERSCGLAPAERLQIDADDDCIACHMPESPTEIPHFAFTHHRIAIHDSGSPPPSQASPPGRLVPLDDVSHLSEFDRRRGLGLAYLQVADLPEHLHHADVYQAEARRLLDDVRRRGLRDPAVDAALARLYWQLDPQRTRELAESVLSADDPSPDDRATALFTLATTAFQQNDLEQARRLLDELVQVRRYADAWHALSICRGAAGDLDGALDAAERAVAISPARVEFQQRLADLYQAADRPQRARELRRLIQQLEQTLAGGTAGRAR